ncbi:hypothetical protein N9Y89_02205 [bacterium]|nr:hypothetical protein [bacterium]
MTNEVWKGAIKLRGKFKAKDYPSVIAKKNTSGVKKVTPLMKQYNSIKAKYPTNLQNIPIRSEKGREVRKTFVPRNDDYILVARLFNLRYGLLLFEFLHDLLF